MLYCDNGGEYLSKTMVEFCNNEGIQYHLAPPYTPVLNGVAKRSNRSVLEKVDAELRRYGFMNSGQDCCVYFFAGINLSDNVYIILYVDDIIFLHW